MKSTICITGLADNYSERITQLMADELNLFYANIIKMLEFDIVDISKTIKICGMNYYKELIAKKLKEVSTFDNTIAYLNYYVLQYDTCIEIFKKKYITIYLQVSEKEYSNFLKDDNVTELEYKLEKSVFKPRDKYFSSKCDIVVKCKNRTEKEVVELIKKELRKYIEKAGK